MKKSLLSVFPFSKLANPGQRQPFVELWTAGAWLCRRTSPARKVDMQLPPRTLSSVTISHTERGAAPWALAHLCGGRRVRL